MTSAELKERDLFALVKKYPGLATRQYWKKLGLSEGALPNVRGRLLMMHAKGLLRYTEVYRGGQVHSRCWWPV